MTHVAGDRESGRYTFEEHTGDVLVHLVAPTFGELFVHAGLALSELMRDSGAPELLSEPEVVTVAARDREALLVAWLNELVFRSETNKRVYTEFRVEHVDEHALRAAIRGVVPPHIRTAVKAATMHRLHIAQDERGYRASVVLDV